MSVEMACDCDDLPSHSHVYRFEPDSEHGGIARSLDTGEVRIWVDWKAVARALSQETAPKEGSDHAH